MEESIQSSSSTKPSHISCAFSKSLPGKVTKTPMRDGWESLEVGNLCKPFSFGVSRLLSKMKTRMNLYIY